MQFLNIDLDIESNGSVDLIIEEFGSRVSVMRNEEIDGVSFVSFETGLSGEDEIIDEYVCLVEALSAKARAQWDACTRRSFDFGYEAEPNSDQVQVIVDESVISLLAGVGGGVVQTIYLSQEKIAL